MPSPVATWIIVSAYIHLDIAVYNRRLSRDLTWSKKRESFRVDMRGMTPSSDQPRTNGYTLRNTQMSHNANTMQQTSRLITSMRHLRPSMLQISKNCPPGSTQSPQHCPIPSANRYDHHHTRWGSHFALTPAAHKAAQTLRNGNELGAHSTQVLGRST